MAAENRCGVAGAKVASAEVAGGDSAVPSAVGSAMALVGAGPNGPEVVGAGSASVESVSVESSVAEAGSPKVVEAVSEKADARPLGSAAAGSGSAGAARTRPASPRGLVGLAPVVAGSPETERVPHVPGFARRDGRGFGKRAGKALREVLPRSVHGHFAPDAHRPDAVTAVRESSAGRLPELTPIRVGRMAATPFAFLRGAAGLMAYDLACGPVTGIGTQICGDAHAANFGLYGDARGRLVIDLNDFDETLYGPWEWDLKRLTTSLVLAGRETGADEEVCRTAAKDAAGAYRRTMRLLAKLPTAEAWGAIADEELVSHADAKDLLGTLERVSEKARRNTSARFAARATEALPDGGRRFVDALPVLRRVSDEEAAAVTLGLGDYLRTLPEDRLPLLARYAVHDVAFRVVGTGSVGTRSYVVLLLDHRGEPLVLQVKEARESALLPHVTKVSLDPRWSGLPLPGVSGWPTAGAVALVGQDAAHEGSRVVTGQKRMQVVSDQLLGWTTVAGRPFQVRQFRNRKGSVDPTALAADQIDDYGRMTGALLARAHSHSADPRLIGGYCGKGEELDEAMAEFAMAYADRTEADHARLVAAVRSGHIAAELGV
ncbi:DUF2252 domain-containing protein [Streptomyces zagrosensis]|uniref:Uncharacterized protein (DUF2252 family) n=1 Tax=Streptomyces zagrosensis TaxID=1042984 RepID=A0A7W9Q5L2_9ACTN|nr:DUF2252 domain-containing protein [Streptomyces zagrosensis]MBB5934058.1 uncharacterized protein (DUF2252 family) [Streptomyces zagrosensis]